MGFLTWLKVFTQEQQEMLASVVTPLAGSKSSKAVWLDPELRSHDNLDSASPGCPQGDFLPEQSWIMILHLWEGNLHKMVKAIYLVPGNVLCQQHLRLVLENVALPTGLV